MIVISIIANICRKISFKKMSNYSFACVFLISILFFTVFAPGSATDDCVNDKVLFCYHASWAIYRPGIASFGAEKINSSLCTHILYSFAGVSIDGVTTSLDPFVDLPGISGGYRQYEKIKNLKESNPCLKIILSVGGWNEGSEKFSLMAESPESRKIFADHLIRYLVYYGFDGVDIDWEYPAQRGGLPEDRENLISLLKQIKDTLKSRGRLLTVALGASEYLLDESYDVSAIGDIADYLLLMTYDYHRNDVTSLLAPLVREANDANAGSIEESINLWLSRGAPRDKLVIGLTTTARSFTLAAPSTNPQNNGLGIPIKDVGPPGRYTNIPGVLAYYELCSLLAEGAWHIFNTGNYACNYATKGDLWLTYENENTILLKSSYVRNLGLAGVMIWSLDTDDFMGYCHRDQYVLVRAVRTGLGI